MLMLCASPIGNLSDITLRVLDALKSCDIIFCEDTRRSVQLLNHFGIHKPLVSCHAHNERERAAELVGLLSAGRTVCYLSDAGMPGISDPGAALVSACIEHNLPYTVLPGASAVLTAAVLSGLPCGTFTFYGFLPRAGKARKEALAEIGRCRHLALLYESPHRVRDTLSALLEALGDCDAAVLRELTKKFETAELGKLSALIARFAEEPRGECVIAVDCASRRQAAPAQDAVCSLDAAIGKALASGLSVKDAAKVAADALTVPKKQAYARALQLKQEG